VKRILLIALIATASARAETVLVEAEGFADRGGWLLDQQFIETMGSPYLLAHGLGVPVADAKTTVAFPAPGTYRVLVRTKDWVAHTNAPGTAGRFQVLVDGKPLRETFGTRGRDWFWHDGGTVRIAKQTATVALHDLTGFEGRCDAVVFTTEKADPPNDLKPLDAFRRKLLRLPEKPAEAGDYDLVVIGGGVAGTCAAVSAARLGLTVALIQNRPVLGGNSSSEVRVWIQGRVMLGPYPRLGEIVRELNSGPRNCPDTAEAHGDERKLKVVQAEKSLALFLNHHAHKVEKQGDRIAAVLAVHIATGREKRFTGRIFADCTGDGTIGFLADADHEMLSTGHMGPSNLWRVTDTGKPTPFPRCPWALDLQGKPFPSQLNRLGKWFWESGFAKDSIQDAEHIRDHNFRAMYGAWDNLKNVQKLHPNHTLEWAAYIAGKRESRRLLGDIVLTQDHIFEGKEFPDGCVPATWSIDLHVPEPRLGKYFEGEEFISVARHKRFKTPYLVPYRCFYSRNVSNLMMAGRDVSVTHEALGTVRVMGTGGMMGEVVGRAAALCKKHNATPRDVYAKHLDELKKLLATPLGKTPAPVSRRQKLLKPPPPFTPPGPNLARTAKVATSGSRDAIQYPPAHLNDGKVDTADNGLRWLSKAESPNWVELAWKEPQTIASARILSGYGSGGAISSPIADFALQAHDGSDWRDIPGAKVTGNANPYWTGAFKPVRAQRVRLYVTMVSMDISRIWEIELYGPGNGGKK